MCCPRRHMSALFPMRFTGTQSSGPTRSASIRIGFNRTAVKAAIPIAICRLRRGREPADERAFARATQNDYPHVAALAHPIHGGAQRLGVVLIHHVEFVRIVIANGHGADAARCPHSEDSSLTTPIDAHQVLMTGESSFIRLSHDGGRPYPTVPATGGCCGARLVPATPSSCRAS